MHTKLCTECITIKSTGLTLTEYESWHKHFSKRDLIAMQGKDIDTSLLNDDICFECSLNNYDRGQCIVVTENTKSEL